MLLQCKDTTIFQSTQVIYKKYEHHSSNQCSILPSRRRYIRISSISRTPIYRRTHHQQQHQKARQKYEQEQNNIQGNTLYIQLPCKTILTTMKKEQLEARKAEIVTRLNELKKDVAPVGNRILTFQAIGLIAGVVWAWKTK